MLMLENIDDQEHVYEKIKNELLKYSIATADSLENAIEKFFEK